MHYVVLTIGSRKSESRMAVVSVECFAGTLVVAELLWLLAARPLLV